MVKRYVYIAIVYLKLIDCYIYAHTDTHTHSYYITACFNKLWVSRVRVKVKKDYMAPPTTPLPHWFTISSMHGEKYILCNLYAPQHTFIDLDVNRYIYVSFELWKFFYHIVCFISAMLLNHKIYIDFLQNSK